MAFIVHEVRNSATIILGNAASLRKHIGTDQEQAILASIEEEARSLSALVSVLAGVAMENSEAGRLAPILLQRVVPKIISRIAPEDGGQEFFLRLPENLPPVKANEPMLEAIFKNLLSNAQKYSLAAEPVFISAEAEPKAVVVTLRNRGVVAPGEVDRLFDLAYRSPSAFERAEGSGIGLAECRALLRFMKGDICASVLEGSTFEVRVRLKPVGDEDKAPAPGAA